MHRSGVCPSVCLSVPSATHGPVRTRERGHRTFRSFCPMADSVVMWWMKARTQEGDRRRRPAPASEERHWTFWRQLPGLDQPDTMEHLCSTQPTQRSLGLPFYIYVNFLSLVILLSCSSNNSTSNSSLVEIKTMTSWHGSHVCLSVRSHNSINHTAELHQICTVVMIANSANDACISCKKLREIRSSNSRVDRAHLWTSGTTRPKNWPNISASTGPIFVIFSPYESALGADDRSVPCFPICQGKLPWQPNNVGRNEKVMKVDWW